MSRLIRQWRLRYHDQGRRYRAPAPIPPSPEATAERNEQRLRLLEAARSNDSGHELPVVVQHLLGAGAAPDAVLEDLFQVCLTVGVQQQDPVLDVMKRFLAGSTSNDLFVSEDEAAKLTLWWLGHLPAGGTPDHGSSERVQRRKLLWATTSSANGHAALHGIVQAMLDGGADPFSLLEDLADIFNWIDGDDGRQEHIAGVMDRFVGLGNSSHHFFEADLTQALLRWKRPRPEPRW